MRFSEEQMDRFYERRICEICFKSFWVRKNVARGKRGGVACLRSRSCKTCSKKCAMKKRHSRD